MTVTPQITGSVDILVNNAGTKARMGEHGGSVLNTASVDALVHKAREIAHAANI